MRKSVSIAPHRPQAAPSARVSTPQWRFRLTVCGLMFAMGLAGLDSNIVNTALPRIASDLHEVNHLSWVVTSFMLGQCVVMPVYGKMSDVYGRRPLFLFATIIFVLSSGLCGLATALPQLAVFRAMQGLGVSGVTILSSVVVADLVPPRERGRYLGLFMGVFAITSLIGPVIGGAITSGLGWRWVFFINLPLGALVLALLLVSLQKSPRPVHRPIDLIGAALMVGAVTTLVLLLSLGGAAYAWTSPLILGLAIACGVQVALLIRQEHRAAEPILDPALFRERTFIACLATSILVAFPFFGAIVYMPLYFQVVLGLSPTASGLALVPQIVGLVVSSNLAGRFAAGRLRHTTLICLGAGGVALGLTLIGLVMGVRPALLPLEVGLFILGLGGGLVRPNLIIIAQTTVDSSRTGAATSSLVFVHTLSGTAGIAVAGAIMNARIKGYLTARHPQLDIHAILTGGLGRLNLLGVVERQWVEAAYGAAISATFLISGLVAGLSIVCALNIARWRGERD